MKMPPSTAETALLFNAHEYSCQIRIGTLQLAAAAAVSEFKLCKSSPTTLVLKADPSYHFTSLRGGSHATFRTLLMHTKNLACYYNGDKVTCKNDADSTSATLADVAALASTTPEIITDTLQMVYREASGQSVDSFPTCPKAESKADSAASWRSD